MKKEEVKDFVQDIITNNVCEGITKDFSELDNLQKVELVMYCEKKYNVEIPDDEIEQERDTDQFVGYLYEIIYDH